MCIHRRSVWKTDIHALPSLNGEIVVVAAVIVIFVFYFFVVRKMRTKSNMLNAIPSK